MKGSRRPHILHTLADGSYRERHLMHTLGYMAKSLNRSAVYLRGLQDRFDLPIYENAAYSDAYLAFLRRIILLRALNVSEDSLRDLWHTEKKLLTLLHVNSTGSPTWFLDLCGQTRHARRRLILTNYDMGVALPSQTIQLGLDFSQALPELFEGKEMGEDAMRVLRQYLQQYSRIQKTIIAEVPLLRSAARWASTKQVPASEG